MAETRRWKKECEFLFLQPAQSTSYFLAFREINKTVGFIRTIRSFFSDIKSEFKRVTWPTREATLQSTGVVLFLTLVVAIFLGVVDLGLSEAVQFLIR